MTCPRLQGQSLRFLLLACTLYSTIAWLGTYSVHQRSGKGASCADLLPIPPLHGPGMALPCLGPGLCRRVLEGKGRVSSRSIPASAVRCVVGCSSTCPQKTCLPAPPQRVLIPSKVTVWTHLLVRSSGQLRVLNRRWALPQPRPCDDLKISGEKSLMSPSALELPCPRCRSQSLFRCQSLLLFLSCLLLLLLLFFIILVFFPLLFLVFFPLLTVFVIITK